MGGEAARADNALERSPFNVTEGSSCGHLLKITLNDLLCKDCDKEKKKKNKAILKIKKEDYRLRQAHFFSLSK